METRVIIGTANFLSIESLCCDAHEERYFFAVVGYPGAGKTLGFSNYKESNEYVYHIKNTASMTAKHLYISILHELGLEGKFNSHKLHEIIKLVSYKLNSISNNNLLILDEAGKFSREDLEFVHELRDATEQTTGIVIAGPNDFEDNIIDWCEKGERGVPEFYSRVNDWIYIERPTKDEIIALCHANNIKDEAFIDMLVKQRKRIDFRIINSKINIFLKKKKKKPTAKKTNV